MSPKIFALLFAVMGYTTLFAQIEKRELNIQRTTQSIKIDGELNDIGWQTASLAADFIELRPTPNRKEDSVNATKIYLLYNNEGLYVGGYLLENNKDSIAKEFIGRDGFGNNDFVGIILDTYNDKLNGFEYFITPLGEQWDAKMSYGGNEDFSWNAVWNSAAKLQHNGWSFEMFIPYSAIRFGKNQVQDWGMNIVRRRQKAGQQIFWQPIDPNVNGFLTQEGLLKKLEGITPPLRLQFSPYFSTYINKDGITNKTKAQVNGGMDVKYGINQAFTLDMTLIPDFGQVISDNRILNLTPFEQKFTENRPFFTEGTELFNKGNLFYSRRIGVDPNYAPDVEAPTGDTLIKYSPQTKILNASKLSGRTQKGLGIGVLNAITQAQSATFQNIANGEKYKLENIPLTNYNILVLDQTLKHNSSVSFVNTNVMRSGNEYDANVSSALFDLNDKTNTWNVGGNVSVSNLFGKYDNKTTTGYAHNLYFGKTSGKFNFRIWQDLINAKYDKSDLGFFTNNNTMDQGLWLGYNITKPGKWYNQINLAWDSWYSRLVSPMTVKKSSMYQTTAFSLDAKAQLKNLWWVGTFINGALKSNDFYESRVYGRVFINPARLGWNLWFESNSAKKFSMNGNLFNARGNIFHRRTTELGLSEKIRFNDKFSIAHSMYLTRHKNQSGWAYNSEDYDTIIFSRRTVYTAENVINMKYNFNNRSGITFRGRHYWSKVDPHQFYQLDDEGKLNMPSSPFTQNVNQNYNYLSVDMVYNWQFAPGSFFSVVWKDIAETFNQEFEKNYYSNLSNSLSGPQFNSLSVKVIYFLDYMTFKSKKNKTA
ncbi:MAG: DUF5916 domain-containing protein [Bacteroidota bacterium]